MGLLAVSLSFTHAHPILKAQTIADMMARRGKPDSLIRSVSGFVPSHAARYDARRTFTTPLLNSAYRQVRSRTASTKLQSLTPKDAEQGLAAQRLHRPVAPHLGIYEWQMGSVLSSLMRITGVAYAGALYIFGLTYLASPYIGLNMSSATLAAAFGALPLAVKAVVKFVVAWPALFHSFNGVKHLIWDNARAITNVQTMRFGWAVVGATTLSTLYLVVYV